MNTFLEILQSMIAAVLLGFSARVGWELYGSLVKNWSAFFQRKNKHSD